MIPAMLTTPRATAHPSPQAAPPRAAPPPRSNDGRTPVRRQRPVHTVSTTSTETDDPTGKASVSAPRASWPGPPASTTRTTTPSSRTRADRRGRRRRPASTVPDAPRGRPRPARLDGRRRPGGAAGPPASGDRPLDDSVHHATPPRYRAPARSDGRPEITDSPPVQRRESAVHYPIWRGNAVRPATSRLAAPAGGASRSCTNPARVVKWGHGRVQGRAFEVHLALERVVVGVRGRRRPHRGDGPDRRRHDDPLDHRRAGVRGGRGRRVRVRAPRLALPQAAAHDARGQAQGRGERPPRRAGLRRPVLIWSRLTEAPPM